MEDTTDIWMIINVGRGGALNGRPLNVEDPFGERGTTLWRPHDATMGETDVEFKTLVSVLPLQGEVPSS